MSNAYRCPICKYASRVTDKPKKEGDNFVRTITYECGTVLKIIQSGYRFKENLTKSVKCVESVLVAV